MNARRTRPAAWLVFLLLSTAASAQPQAGHPALAGHAIVLDAQGKLLSWVQPQDRAYAEVARLAFSYLLERMPVEANGLPTIYTYCCFDGSTLRGTGWPHNPVAVNAGLALGASAYYRYSGDERVVRLAGALLTHHILNGSTPAGWDWSAVPYASSDHGAVRYRGAFDFAYDRQNPGRGDGYGVIEPDKLGEAGVAYLEFWKLTGQPQYRDAALACARALAHHVRTGDGERSPWPFRVYAETGIVREEYCANVAPALRLFDELRRLSLGEQADFERARGLAYEWMMAHPAKDDSWANYFEDIPWQAKPSNLNQYDALEAARYLLETGGPGALEAARHAVEWTERTFGGDLEKEKEKGVQWGAIAISEQLGYMYKMGSHTSRFGSVQALLAEKTGDAVAKDKAFRSLNWASYMCDERGVVRVGPVEPSIWFSDGYADYVRHFMAGMASVPEWTPRAESHLLRTSSTVKTVSYSPARVAFSSFDDEGTAVLRLAFVPSAVLAGGAPLPASGDLSSPGWSFDPATGVLRLRYAGTHAVEVRGGPGTTLKRR